jgi:hypothetical protein
MKRRRHQILPLILAAAAVVAIAASAGPLWLGRIPARYLPLARIDLDDPSGLLLDFRLAALRRDAETCGEILRLPHILAAPVPDRPAIAGCGWHNAVRVREVAGLVLPIDRITCEAAAALALWLAHEVQPLAERHFGRRIVRIASLGTYSCRNIAGNLARAGARSEHASANAIDIAGFILADGRQVSVARHWDRGGSEQRFLRDAHRRACRYFRGALSPDFNAAHRDHFHLDRGDIATCR